jgi:hypothetical protein
VQSALGRLGACLTALLRPTLLLAARPVCCRQLRLLRPGGRGGGRGGGAGRVGAAAAGSGPRGRAGRRSLGRRWRAGRGAAVPGPARSAALGRRAGLAATSARQPGGLPPGGPPRSGGTSPIPGTSFPKAADPLAQLPRSRLSARCRGPLSRRTTAPAPCLLLPPQGTPEPGELSVPVSCGTVRGTFYPLSRLVRCRCGACRLEEDAQGRAVYHDPQDFERHGGMSRLLAAGLGRGQAAGCGLAAGWLLPGPPAWCRADSEPLRRRCHQPRPPPFPAAHPSRPLPARPPLPQPRARSGASPSRSRWRGRGRAGGLCRWRCGWRSRAWRRPRGGAPRAQGRAGRQVRGCRSRGALCAALRLQLQLRSIRSLGRTDQQQVDEQLSLTE